MIVLATRANARITAPVRSFWLARLFWRLPVRLPGRVVLGDADHFLKLIERRIGQTIGFSFPVSFFLHEFLFQLLHAEAKVFYFLPPRA